jgi:SHS2 domain-containing protein
MIFPDPPQLGLPDLQDSLTELTSNYQNSLQDAGANSADQEGSDRSASQHSGIDPSFQMYNFLSRDSSLVDLAMLVPTNADDAETSASVDPTPVNEMSSSNIPFLDFLGMDPPNTTGKSN